MQWNTPHLRDILDQLHDGVYFVDTDRRITFWNKAAEEITGHPAKRVIGRHCYDNILSHVDCCGKQLCHACCPLQHTINHGTKQVAEIYLHHKDGHRVPITAKCSPMYDENGLIIGGIETFTHKIRNASHQKRIEELERAALLDPLTQLPNRRYLKAFLANKFDEQAKHGWPFAVILSDIDCFKNINDSFGHNFGDEILKLIGQTLKHATRPYDLTGRWGGEEFLTIISNADVCMMHGIAERMRVLVERSSISHLGRPFSTTVSLGVAVSSGEDTLETIIERADTLLYRSKRDGRNRTTSQESVTRRAC